MDGRAHATSGTLISTAPLAVIIAVSSPVAAQAIIDMLNSGHVNETIVSVAPKIAIYLLGALAGSQMPDMDIFYGKNILKESAEGLVQFFEAILAILSWASRRKKRLTYLLDKYRSAFWGIFAPVNFVFVLIMRFIVGLIPSRYVRSKKWGHRTYTHSLLGWAVASIMFGVASVFVPSPWNWGFYGAIFGWIGHIIGDMTTISGVMLQWPFSTRDYHIVPPGMELHMTGLNPPNEKRVLDEKASKTVGKRVYKKVKIHQAERDYLRKKTRFQQSLYAGILAFVGLVFAYGILLVASLIQ